MNDTDAVQQVLEMAHRFSRLVAALRAAGVTAELQYGEAFTGSGSRYASGAFAGTDAYFREQTYAPNGETVASVFTCGEGAMSFGAPTMAGAVALAAENPDMRRWLGLPEPVTDTCEHIEAVCGAAAP